MPKIYTKNGDLGMTSMPALGKIKKTDSRVAAVGELDELNAHLGLVATILDEDIREIIFSIQSTLLCIGAEVATLNEFGESKLEFGLLSQQLEACIDGLSEELPPLTNFILPGGSTQASSIHIARAVCRRCERSLADIGYPVQYVNRLSDFLFTLARVVNKMLDVKEVIWRKK